MLSALVNRGANLAADSRAVTMATPVVFANPIIASNYVVVPYGKFTSSSYAMNNPGLSDYQFTNQSVECFGYGSTADTSPGGYRQLAVGYNARTVTVYSTAIGSLATAGGPVNAGAIAIGDNCRVIDSGSAGQIGLGNGIYCRYMSNNLLIGDGISSGFSTITVLAHNGVATASNQFIGGSSTSQMNNVFFGKGVSNGTPTSYTINGTGGSGSNIKGADVAIAGGLHTGTPSTFTTGHVKLQTSLVGASASTLNSLVDRYIVKASRLALTDATIVNVFDVALPTLTGCMGTIQYEIFCTDGTDVQVRRGMAQYSAVNKGAVYTSEVAIGSEAASCSSGTLTATWDILTGTNKITLRVNADTSLTPTTFYLCYTLENNSEQAITIL